MKWKEFLRPTKGKLILTFIFFSITLLISDFFYNEVLIFNFCTLKVTGGGCFRAFGLPLPFVLVDGSFLNLDNIIALVIDILFWYFLTSLIVKIYNKVKK